MPGFYYFLPNVTKQELLQGDRFNRDLLVARGLGDVLAEVELWPKQMSVCEGPGPESQSGVTLYPVPQRGLEDDVPVEFDLQRQTWLAVDDGADRWIGWITGRPPAPFELARTSPRLSGYEITDEHGRNWEIPIARSPQNPSGNLPQNYLFERDGTSKGFVKSQHVGLWNLAGEVWDAFNYRAWKRAQDAGEDPSSERPVDLPDDDPPPGDAHDEAWLREVALRLLGVNYRIGYAELNALATAGVAVLDDTRIHFINAALIDFDFVLEVQKKTTEASAPRRRGTSGSRRGGKVAIQTTAQATEN